MTGSVFERLRRYALFLSLTLFMMRVAGQLIAGLCEPSWLPPFSAWESGLLPYWILLPVQIALMAWTIVIIIHHFKGAGRFWVQGLSTRITLQRFAKIYVALMALRLLITAVIPPHNLLERGLLPVLAHWDLAAFIYLVSLTPTAGQSQDKRPRNAAGLVSPSV